MSYDTENYPIGVDEVSKILGVKPATVSTWNARKSMPKPDAYLNKGRTRLWEIKTIIDWASATGRNPMDITTKQAHYIVAVSDKYDVPPSKERYDNLKSNWDNFRFSTGDWDFDDEK